MSLSLLEAAARIPPRARMTLLLAAVDLAKGDSVGCSGNEPLDAAADAWACEGTRGATPRRADMRRAVAASSG